MNTSNKQTTTTLLKEGIKMKAHRNLRELNFYKNLARKQGNEGKMITNLPITFKYGQVAEVAVAAILGRLQAELKERGIKFYIECNAEMDMFGTDFWINRRPLSLASGFTYTQIMSFDDCNVKYDIPGVKNLSAVLEYVGLEPYYLDNKTIGDINNLWFSYMNTYILDAEGVRMKNIQ